MKKISLASVLLAACVFTSSVYADIPLESKEQVQGTWKLQYTKNNEASKDKIQREDTWIFKDGKITILNIPREGTHYDQAPINFVIEDNKLKIPYVGRSGFDTFALVEVSDSSLVLKGKFGEIYYFVKK